MSRGRRVVGVILGLDPRDEEFEVVSLSLGGTNDRDFGFHDATQAQTTLQLRGDRMGRPIDGPRSGAVYCPFGGVLMPSFPRFLFRVKDRQIEEEAHKMVDAFGIEDVEIRRDDTIKDAWFEDSVSLKTTFGLDDIREYLEDLTSR